MTAAIGSNTSGVQMPKNIHSSGSDWHSPALISGYTEILDGKIVTDVAAYIDAVNELVDGKYFTVGDAGSFNGNSANYIRQIVNPKMIVGSDIVRSNVENANKLNTDPNTIFLYTDPQDDQFPLLNNVKYKVMFGGFVVPVIPKVENDPDHPEGRKGKKEGIRHFAVKMFNSIRDTGKFCVLLLNPAAVRAGIKATHYDLSGNKKGINIKDGDIFPNPITYRISDGASNGISDGRLVTLPLEDTYWSEETLIKVFQDAGFKKVRAVPIRYEEGEGASNKALAESLHNLAGLNPNMSEFTGPIPLYMKITGYRFDNTGILPALPNEGFERGLGSQMES